MNEEPKQNELEPVDMLLYCPNCFEQHVDKAEPDVCQDCGHYKFEHEHMSGDDVRECRGGSSMCSCVGFHAWLNPPHKSHRCTFCNHVWRPSDVPTNGVQTLATSGKADGSPRPVAFANGKYFQESHADLQAKYDRLAACLAEATEIRFHDYHYIRRVAANHWNLNRRGHRVGGPIFISGHDSIESALAAYLDAQEKENA